MALNCGRDRRWVRSSSFLARLRLLAGWTVQNGLGIDVIAVM